MQPGQDAKSSGERIRQQAMRQAAQAMEKAASQLRAANNHQAADQMLAASRRMVGGNTSQNDTPSGGQRLGGSQGHRLGGSRADPRRVHPLAQQPPPLAVPPVVPSASSESSNRVSSTAPNRNQENAANAAVPVGERRYFSSSEDSISSSTPPPRNQENASAPTEPRRYFPAPEDSISSSSNRVSSAAPIRNKENAPNVAVPAGERRYYQTSESSHASLASSNEAMNTPVASTIVPLAQKLKVFWLKDPAQKFTIMSNGTPLEAIKPIMAVCSPVIKALIVPSSDLTTSSNQALQAVEGGQRLGGGTVIPLQRGQHPLLQEAHESAPTIPAVESDMVITDIEINEFSAKVVEKMIEFCENDKIADFEGCEEDLFKIGHKYQITDLMLVAVYQLIKTTTSENAFDRLKLGMMYDLKDLVIACSKHVSRGY